MAIVDKGDWGSGTSSKSSKLVHGGLRYLQQKEYRLVYENLRERQRLLRNAPHLVRVMPFLIPLFGKQGVTSKTVAKAYSTALTLYDLTGGWRIGKLHRRISVEETIAHMGGLSKGKVAAGFLYYDARPTMPGSPSPWSAPPKIMGRSPSIIVACGPSPRRRPAS